MKIWPDRRKNCALAAAALSCAFAALVLSTSDAAREIKWLHLSSRNGDLPNPGGSNEQTGLLVANLDKSTTTGFVISYRVNGPALVWFRRVGNGWSRYVIYRDFLTIEAGGAAYDIDGDGDLDIVFGGDSQNNELWWWENPYPNFDPNIPWKRHIIKKGWSRSPSARRRLAFVKPSAPRKAISSCNSCWRQRY